MNLLLKMAARYVYISLKYTLTLLLYGILAVIYLTLTGAKNQETIQIIIPFMGSFLFAWHFLALIILLAWGSWRPNLRVMSDEVKIIGLIIFGMGYVALYTLGLFIFKSLGW